MKCYTIAMTEEMEIALEEPKKRLLDQIPEKIRII